MFKKIILDNGIRVVTCQMPQMKSVSVGLWLKTGSRCETSENNGVSHFIEHMLFKGTSKRSARKIAEIFDSIGGQINAFTSKECTCYYTKTLDTYLDISLDVLSDMLFNSCMSTEEMGLERNVVLEEIDMYEDSPEEIVHDLVTELTWKKSLGYPILGQKENIESITREKVMEYINQNYTLNRLVISVAGNFDEKSLYKLVDKYFGNREKTCSDIKYKENFFNSGKIVKTKETEQINMCISYPGFNASEG
jgi:predicted Zn-dependent peptidase